MTQGDLSDLDNDTVCSECGDIMEIEGELMKCPACGYTMELDELGEIDDVDAPTS